MKGEDEFQVLLTKVDQLTQRNADGLRDVFITFCADKDVRTVRRQLACWLSRVADLELLKTAARETPTHFVWPIYRSASGFSVVVNEFKDTTHMGDGYAKSLHNHRYSFASIVLSGGYTECKSVVTLRACDELVDIVDGDSDRLSEGDITLVDHEAFHRLMAVTEHTVTLLVKTPALKAYSASVDVGTRIVSRHVPVEARVPRLVAALL